jgi:hypothetical protein
MIKNITAELKQTQELEFFLALCSLRDWQKTFKMLSNYSRRCQAVLQLYRVIMFCNNYLFPLPISPFITIIYPTQLPTHVEQYWQEVINDGHQINWGPCIVHQVVHSTSMLHLLKIPPFTHMSDTICLCFCSVEIKHGRKKQRKK